MLREGISKIEEMALDRKNAIKVYEDETILVLNVGGEFREIEKPRRRDHTVHSVDDLIAAVDRFASNGAATIWISETIITAILDDEPRIDRVDLPLTYGPTFQKLIDLNDKSFNQHDLIRLFRYELTGVSGVQNVLQAIRNIKFKSLEAGQSDLQHGRESISGEVLREVTGATDIPEECMVNCRVYANPREISEYAVKCYLQVFPQRQMFTFRAAAGELDEIRIQALEKIRDRIENGVGENVPVYFGTP